jgi:hypothetical protein
MLSSAAAASVALGSLPRVARELADIGILNMPKDHFAV